MKRRWNLENSDDLRKIRKKVALELRKYQLLDRLDDVFHHVCIKYLEDPGSNQAVSYAVIDWLREEFGSHRSQKGRAKNSVLMGHGSVQFNEEFMYPNIDREIHLESIDKLISFYPPKSRHRIIAKLYAIYGLTLGEIADLLEVSESRISQLLAQFTEKLGLTIKTKEKEYASKNSRGSFVFQGSGSVCASNDGKIEQGYR